MKATLVTALLLALVSPVLARSHRTYPMEIPAAGVRTINFDVQEGDFVLRGDPSATQIQMQVSIDRYWLFKLGEADILNRLIKVSGEGTDAVTIRTDIPRAVSNWGRAQYPVDFEIVVPAGAILNVLDTSGKIEISAMNNGVNVHDGSGTLAVSGVAGPLTIEKESGDIRVADISGATRISSHSGQIHIQHVADLDVTASDGNLDVTGVGAARLVNKGGNITISRATGNVQIDDESGEIQVRDVAGPVSIHDASGQIRASHVGKLAVDDTSGDVVVDHAANLDIRSKESGQVKASNIAGEVRVPPGINLNRR